MGDVPAYPRVPSKQAHAKKILQFPKSEIQPFFGVPSVNVYQDSKTVRSLWGPKKSNMEPFQRRSKNDFTTCWIWPSLGSMFNFGHVGPRVDNSVEKLSFCRRRLDSRRANLSTTCKFQGFQHVLSNKVRASKKCKKKKGWIEANSGGITKKTRATLSSEKPSWFGFHPFFFWQNPLVRLTRSPFCWFNRSIPISAGKIPTCGTSGLKTNRVFIVKNHAACCCIWCNDIQCHNVSKIIIHYDTGFHYKCIW